MINISDIEINKKFKATFKGFTVLINYRIDEGWFSSLYYDSNEVFIFKDVQDTNSEQEIIKVIKRKVNKILKTQYPDKYHILNKTIQLF